MDSFDADVLIYAATRGHELGRRVRALFTGAPKDGLVGVGSVLLLPELLAKPLRSGYDAEVAELGALLSRLELLPVDVATAELAVGLAARHGLRAADAVHLASAVIYGADRFITNNRRDFSESIEELEITFPANLPDPIGQ